MKELPYRQEPYSKKNWGNPNHSLCSYQGKLKPSIANFLVQTFVPPKGRVLDPFSGVGTIPFEAALNMAQANVQECLGVSPERAKQIAEDSLRRFGRMVVEVLRFPLLNKDNISQTVKVEGLEHLEKAYAEGKGVIMCTGHYGNWELLGATVALHGYPMLSITRKQNNANMDKAINEFRQMVGQKVTYNRGEHGLLAISRML